MIARHRSTQGSAPMTTHDREQLIRRIRQIHRSVAPLEGRNGAAGNVQPDRLQTLEARVAHLEQTLKGLQDSVHTELERHARLIAELQVQIEPAAMGAALAEGTRCRSDTNGAC